MLSELEESLGDIPSADAYGDSERLASILSDFVYSLDVTSRVIFIRRYVYFESIPSIAQRFEMTENAVSVKLHRARRKLKKLLEKEGHGI